VGRFLDDEASMKRKIWLGIGAFVYVGSGGATDPSFAAAPQAISDVSASRPTHELIAQHQPQDRQAGEAGETENLAKLPRALAFATRIALVRGHLLVGDELVRQQQWNAALPHFLHPSEELYGDIKGDLQEYRTPPFDRALKMLSDAVKVRRGGEAYSNALKTVNDALAAADAGLKAQQDNWAGFVVETAVETIKMASGEYQQAIVRGRIAKPVEYQDARGFIGQANAMIESVAADLQEKDPAALQALRAGLTELNKAFPSAMPPSMPIKDAGAVLLDVSRIELTAGKLM
jgi:hypothetical protein